MVDPAKSLVILGWKSEPNKDHLIGYIEEKSGVRRKLNKGETRISEDKKRALLVFKSTTAGAESLKKQSLLYCGHKLKVVDYYEGWNDSVPTAPLNSATKQITPKSPNRKPATGRETTVKTKSGTPKADKVTSSSVQKDKSTKISAQCDAPVAKQTLTKGAANKSKQSKSPEEKGLMKESSSSAGKDIEHPVSATQQASPKLSSDQPSRIVLHAPQDFIAENKQRVHVLKTDITKLKVDAIVNAANKDLKNIGGVALAIARASGPELQKACDKLIKSRGSLSVSHVAATAGFKLPAKHVIHVVGPMWREHKSQECTKLLYDSFKRCLDEAATLKVKSIAIPAVSSGIYGVPIHIVSEQMCRAVSDFCIVKTPVQDIHLVDINDAIPNQVVTDLQEQPGITLDGARRGKTSLSDRADKSANKKS